MFLTIPAAFSYILMYSKANLSNCWISIEFALIGKPHGYSVIKKDI